ncbi:hypothetical protein R6Q57_011434 [Mikania cordata]
MDEQYGITDLTHYMNGRPIFTAITQPPSQPHDLHYDMAMLGGGGGLLFRSDSTAGAASTTGGGLEMEIGGGLENEIGGGGGGNCRWPRQETLTLLEVRSSLDSKFKEANHKGPLWDEVSRIMSEEHGYQRSGKKCREKFENLYKYYKKTKEGKAGRQDGKHYRFFRQLEALYGETSTSINPNTTPITAPFSDPHNLGIETCGFQAHQHSNTNYQELFKPANPNSRMCDSPTLSNNSSAFDTCSSGYTNPNALIMEKSNGVDTITNTRRLGKRGWKTKIKEFVDAQMRKVMEKQEEWMEKMMRSIEQKEQERVLREEQWRKEENERFEKEHKFWANERAWMESRDAALMEALQRLNGKESCHKSSPDDQNVHDHNNGKIDPTVNVTTWGQNELTQLIQLRTSMETRFEHGVGHMEELLWEEIASKMACMGYNRNGVTCKHKWDSINEFLLKTKKRKESTRSSNYPDNETVPHIFHHEAGNYRQLADHRLVASNDESNDGGHRFLVVGQENMWDGYGMKLRMGEDH